MIKTNSETINPEKFLETLVKDEIKHGDERLTDEYFESIGFCTDKEPIEAVSYFRSGSSLSNVYGIKIFEE